MAFDYTGITVEASAVDENNTGLLLLSFVVTPEREDTPIILCVVCEVFEGEPLLNPPLLYSRMHGLAVQFFVSRADN